MHQYESDCKHNENMIKLLPFLHSMANSQKEHKENIKYIYRYICNVNS